MLPFRWTPGQIEVQVRMNARAPIWCIVDSGAEFSIVDRATAGTLRLGQPRAKDGRQQIENMTFDMGPIRMAKQSVTLLSLDNFRRQKRDIRCVIGCDLFERFLITVDYERRALIVSNPASFVAKPGAVSVPITFAGRLPVMETLLQLDGRSIRSRLMVDTGASQALILRHPFALKHRLFRQDDAGSLSETLASGKRAFEQLGAGQLTFGPSTVYDLNVLAYGSPAGAGGHTATDGLLGNDVCCADFG